MKRFIHKYESLVIGASIEALLYSYLNNIPVFCGTLKPPKEFEYSSVEDDYSFLKIENRLKTINVNEEERLVGIPKIEIWNTLVFLLSIAGLMPYANEIDSIRIEDELIKITTQNSRLYLIEAKNILIFDDENVEGLGVPSQVDNDYVVYDWLIAYSMTPHKYDLLTTQYDFAKEIWFVPAMSKVRWKDICIVSYAKSMIQIQNDLTDYILTFTLKDVFKQNKIKGCSNGLRNGKQRFLNVKYEFSYREIVKIKANLYDDHNNIKFLKLSISEIMQQNKVIPSKMDYLCNRLRSKANVIKPKENSI